MMMRWLSSRAISAAAAIAATTTAAVFVRPLVVRVVRRLLLRRRIRRVHASLDALQSVAAVSRGLSQQYSKQVAKADAGKAEVMQERIASLRKMQRRSLAGLTDARRLIDNLLLQLHDGGCGNCIVDGSGDLVLASERRLHDEMARESNEAVRILGPSAAHPGASSPPTRSVILEEEWQAVEALARGPTPPVQPRALRHALRALRALESSLDFQAELLVQQLASQRTTAYSRENFAYGSTPLQSWLALFACEPVRSALSESPAPRYLVLGSSLGWLCVYGACVFGLRTRGIELLPSLAAAAARLVKEAGVAGVTLECADMLECDLSDAEIVLLASQCWDATLIAALRAKLLAELPDRALVLDYTAALGEAPPAPRQLGRAAAPGPRPNGVPPQAGGGRRLTLECTVQAPVSWDSAHTFWVWRVGVQT